MKIAVVGHMPSNGYSGGRYCAWIMTEALAHEGNTVYFISNAIPQFARDFSIYPNHNRIRTVITDDLCKVDLCESRLDYVICIPGGEDKEYFVRCMLMALSHYAIFALINFESPNWFQTVNKMNHRFLGMYRLLKEICRYRSLIISLDDIARNYAKDYYNAYSSKTEFGVWSPPINSIVADAIEVDRQNQVIIFMRLQDEHKGGGDFWGLLGDYLSGMTCVCVIGNGRVSATFIEESQKVAGQYNINLVFRSSLSDVEKFTELRKSKLLYFPSYFEGYGYPPIEALYCGTKCVAYDLPVLRETCGDALTYCRIGDVREMKALATELLNSNDFKERCVDTAEFEQQANRLDVMLRDFLNRKNLRPVDEVQRKRYISELEAEIEDVKKWNDIPEIIRQCARDNQIISECIDPQEEVWEEIAPDLYGKHIFLWGCGKAHEQLYKKYSGKMRVEGIIDTSLALIGKVDKTSGMPVQSPDILKQYQPEDVVVFITGKNFVDEIVTDLKGYRGIETHSLCLIELNDERIERYKEYIASYYEC